MKICLAQIKPIRGNIPENIIRHKKFIELATESGAEMVVFPELSITGYEPALAKGLALSADGPQLEIFQETSDNKNVTIGIGAPTIHQHGICISLILFQPGLTRKVYSKKFIHKDEEPYFVSGENFRVITIRKLKISFAICYELSVSEHAKTAFLNGARFYIASVAKSKSGVRQAGLRLSEIAKDYSMTVFMVNSIGPSDNFISAGSSSVWSNKGVLTDQLDDSREGILMLDTKTGKIVKNVFT